MCRNKQILYIVTVLLAGVSILLSALWGAKREANVPIFVTVASQDGEQAIRCWEQEGAYYIFLPGYASLQESRVKLTTEAEIYLDGTQLKDGMGCDAFCVNVPYELSYTAWGKEYTKKLVFMQSSSIAAMYINTASETMEYIHNKKGNEEEGIYFLYDKTGALDNAGALTSIKGRGNSTWADALKKPYSIELSEEKDLLGLGMAQKWILLANAIDPSHLKNKMVYDFAASIGMPFSPSTEWIDLYLNGEYAGLYLLCERNEVHPNRIDIAHEDSVLVSLEKESRMVQQNYLHIVTRGQQTLRLHYPRNTTAEDLSKLKETWQSVEDSIFAKDGVDPRTGKSWLEQIDLDSWVRKYLIEEVFGNHDAFECSQFFYYDANKADGKIVAGPVWDYDISMGTDYTWQNENPCSFVANKPMIKPGGAKPWVYALYQKEQFYRRMTELYRTEFLAALHALVTEQIFTWCDALAGASAMNQIRWSVTEDIHAHTRAVSDYMLQRMAFLSSVWLDGDTYYFVRIQGSVNTNYAYYAVVPNQQVTYLPQFEDKGTSVFSGWYYEDTDEPFDITKPITEDIEIYAKWEDSASKRLGQVGKLLPLAVISLLGAAVLLTEIKRMKKWVTKDGQTKRTKISS